MDEFEEGSAAEKPKLSQSISASFADMFQCGPSTVDYTTYESEVPGMVIPGDVDSVGDLTAISHEFKAKRKYSKKQEKKIPLPVALGGSGLCSNIRVVDDVEDIPFELTHSSSTLGASVLSLSKENYFSEYDDYSIRRPRSNEVGCNADSKESLDEC